MGTDLGGVQRHVRSGIGVFLPRCIDIDAAGRLATPRCSDIRAAVVDQDRPHRSGSPFPCRHSEDTVMQAELAGAVVMIGRVMARHNAQRYECGGCRTMISRTGCEKAPMI